MIGITDATKAATKPIAPPTNAAAGFVSQKLVARLHSKVCESISCPNLATENNPVTIGDKLFAFLWQKLQSRSLAQITRIAFIHAVLRVVSQRVPLAAHTGFEPVYRP